MSHIHIPDGIIAVWLWVLGYLAVGIYFIAFSRHVKKTGSYKKVTIASVLGALMLLSMSIPIPFFLPYHLNLSALAGILAGPFYAVLAIFSVNMILALAGHGGITIVGLNTVVIGAEAAVAYLLFSLVRHKTGNKMFLSAFLATFFALVASSLFTVGIIYFGTNEILDLSRFLTLIAITGGLGWTLESLITGFIVNYISRVKPDLIK